MDNRVARDPLEDLSDSSSMNTTEDIENLLDVFSNDQGKVRETGNSGSRNEEALLSETDEGITLYGTTEGNKSQVQIELSLNSSGYGSSSSPPSADLCQPSYNLVNVDQAVRVIPVQSSSEIHHGGSDDRKRSNYSSQVERCPYNSPMWFKELYPELHSAWMTTSGSQFYQGGVRMLCSRCKDRYAAGFHEGLPLCEACRVGSACTVCRIRVASCFSHGLAICEADRVFLHRILKNQTNFNKCRDLCPVTVQKWCGYCRLRTCISVKGFRFLIPASTGHLSSDKPLHKLRKYSGTGSCRELDFLPESINQDKIYLSPQQGR